VKEEEPPFYKTIISKRICRSKKRYARFNHSTPSGRRKERSENNIGDTEGTSKIERKHRTHPGVSSLNT